MSNGSRIAAAGLLLLAACARPEPPPKPDVVLVTIDRLRWEELSPWGGGVAAPHVGAWRDAGAEWTQGVSLAPGGAPAALTVLTGLPPSGHGVRLLDAGRIAPAAQTLGDRLGAEGWATGAFLQSDQVSLFMQADRGFSAWDGPLAGFPTGHPGSSQRRGLEETAASGLHWLLQLPATTPGLLWIHLAEPAPPHVAAAERATRLGELDRILGAVRDSVLHRGRERGVAPVLIACALSSHGADPARAAREGYLLDAAALRVRVIASAPRLEPRVIDEPAGLDEVADLVVALARGEGSSRMLDLARGRGESRADVVAEGTWPVTCCGADPVAAAFGSDGTVRGGADRSVAAAIAADAGWPGGSGGLSGEQALPAFLELDRAWTLHAAGRGEEALAQFDAAVAAGAQPGALVGRGLALASLGRAADALTEFEVLREGSPHGSQPWTQAVLGVALSARALGDAAKAQAAVDALLADSPGDLRALTLQAEIAESAGRTDQAVASLRALLDQDPDNPFALAELGRLSLTAGRSREAADALTKALARRPTHPGLLLAAAEAQAAAGDWWSAIDRVNERVKLYGESAETDLVLARAWRDTGRFALAEEWFSKYVARRPGDARARLALAEAKLQQGKEEEGLVEWKRARDLAPGDPGACALLRSWAASTGRAPEEIAAAGCP